MAAGPAAYRKLVRRSREIAFLSCTGELLSWDQETYLPPKAIDWRAEQQAYLSGAAHRLSTATAVGNWIQACEDHGFPPDSDASVNIREWRRTYDRAAKVPRRLVEKLERTRTHARAAWVKARRQSDFKSFQPHLCELVELQLRLADCWGYEDSPYDALLEEFEPGARSRPLRDLFAGLRREIMAILEPAVEATRSISANVLDDHYPVEEQAALNRKVAAAMGFDLEAGRIDTTTHPFCTSLGPQDCRLTTRYNLRDFTQSLYCVMHEAGHGLYDQGLPREHFGTPRGTYCSLGIHESQSRLWENHVGRSRAFWDHWHPVACDHFPNLKRLDPQTITAAVNRVEPSFIRVHADEVTYDLHIALRFEVEVKLIQRELKAADVPAFWNEQFEKMLGLRVTDDANGCLQDTHWSIGCFGYFPTYTLGNLNASQLMLAARDRLPGLDAAVAQGDGQPLLKWLRENVHRQGRRFTAGALIEQATGSPTGTQAHIAHLRSRFLRQQTE